MKLLTPSHFQELFLHIGLIITSPKYMISLSPPPSSPKDQYDSSLQRGKQKLLGGVGGEKLKNNPALAAAINYVNQGALDSVASSIGQFGC